MFFFFHMRFFVSVTFVFRLSLPIVQKNEQFLPVKGWEGARWCGLLNFWCLLILKLILSIEIYIGKHIHMQVHSTKRID